MVGNNSFDIIGIAKSCIGTPFIVGASIANVGCDCAGLLEIILRSLGREIPKRNQTLKNAIQSTLKMVDIPQVGDVILLQNNDDLHCGILCENNILIHAHWSRGVVENTYGRWFRTRTIGFYSFG